MNDVGEAEVPGGGAGGGGNHPEEIIEEELDPARALAHQGTGTVKQRNFSSKLPVLAKKEESDQMRWTVWPKIPREL